MLMRDIQPYQIYAFSHLVCAWPGSCHLLLINGNPFCSEIVHRTLRFALHVQDDIRIMVLIGFGNDGKLKF